MSESGTPAEEKTLAVTGEAMSANEALILAKELLPGLPRTRSWKISESGISFDVGLLTRVRCEAGYREETRALMRFLSLSGQITVALIGELAELTVKLRNAEAELEAFRAFKVGLVDLASNVQKFEASVERLRALKRGIDETPNTGEGSCEP